MPQVVSIPILDAVPALRSTYDWMVEFYPTLLIWVEGVFSGVIIISIILSVFFMIGIIYTVEKLKVIRKKEAEKHDVLAIEPGLEDVKGKAAGSQDLTVRWGKVHSHMGTDNENDWKQAILEADTMLDDILNSLGYRGESIGEKLKRVQPGEFKTLDDAWEAHKVRNRIAHEPGFHITHHEANQTIQRYRRVFEEFYYI